MEHLTSNCTYVTGTISGNCNLLSDNDPIISFNDANNDPDYRIMADLGNLSFVY